MILFNNKNEMLREDTFTSNKTIEEQRSQGATQSIKKHRYFKQQLTHENKIFLKSLGFNLKQ